MDSVDVFRQLGGGVRFNKKKYADDIDFFKVPYHLRDRSFHPFLPLLIFTTRSCKIRSPCATLCVDSFVGIITLPWTAIFLIIFNSLLYLLYLF
jgi:hypothetical protein